MDVLHLLKQGEVIPSLAKSDSDYCQADMGHTCDIRLSSLDMFAQNLVNSL